MKSQLRPAFVSFLLLTLITGVLYPVIVTVVAKVAFAHQAEGSMIEKSGIAVGSDLIGQPFTDPKYFWSRPSATSPAPYAADAGTGSNLGPTNPALAEAIQQRTAALRAADPTNEKPIPVDLVTASASGLDPHISPEAAEYQVARIANTRRVSVDAVRACVATCTEPRTLWVLGEPRVNVVRLNRTLDEPAALQAAQAALSRSSTEKPEDRTQLIRGKGFSVGD